MIFETELAMKIIVALRKNEPEILSVFPKDWTYEERVEFLQSMVATNILEIAYQDVPFRERKKVVYKLSAEQIEPTSNEMEDELIKNRWNEMMKG